VPRLSPGSLELLLGSLAALLGVDVAYESARIGAAGISNQEAVREPIFNLQLLAIALLIAFVFAATWVVIQLWVVLPQWWRVAAVVGAMTIMAASVFAFLQNAAAAGVLFIISVSAASLAGVPVAVRWLAQRFVFFRRAPGLFVEVATVVVLLLSAARVVNVGDFPLQAQLAVVLAVSVLATLAGRLQEGAKTREKASVRKRD